MKNEAAFCLAVIFIFLLNPISASSQSYQQNGSWALGVVVQNNFLLSNGQELQWNEAKNISVVLKLPHIKSTDKTIMCVESLMVGNGTIIQASVALYPNSTFWTVSGMYVPNPWAYPQKYVIQQHFGLISAGSLISLSLNVTDNGWVYSVFDYNNSELIYSRLPVYGNPVNGYQYLIAFESYSYNSTVFENMSYVAFYKIFVNGKKVVKGLEPYTGWSMSLSPLFIVGGENIPPFISMFYENGSYFITYYNGWLRNESSPLNVNLFASVILAAAALLNFVFLIIIVKKLKPFKKQSL